MPAPILLLLPGLRWAANVHAECERIDLDGRSVRPCDGGLEHLDIHVAGQTIDRMLAAGKRAAARMRERGR
jgi:hypothetical protein